MFGVHQGFVPVYFALMDAQGFNFRFPILSMAGAELVVAYIAGFVLTILFGSKNIDLD